MKQQVLLVDDDPHILQALKRALRNEPYEVLTAESAKAGLELLQGVKVDVVVSDEMMPQMTGTEFLSMVKNEYPETVRIMLTGQADLDVAMKAINDGEIYRFFLKPCNDIDLAIGIREALQQKALAKQTRRLVDVLQMQSSYIENIEENNPGITQVKRDEKGAIIISDLDSSLEDIMEEALQEIERTERSLGAKKS